MFPVEVVLTNGHNYNNIMPTDFTKRLGTIRRDLCINLTKDWTIQQADIWINFTSTRGDLHQTTVTLVKGHKTVKMRPGAIKRGEVRNDTAVDTSAIWRLFCADTWIQLTFLMCYFCWNVLKLNHKFDILCAKNVKSYPQKPCDNCKWST